MPASQLAIGRSQHVLTRVMDIYRALITRTSHQLREKQTKLRTTVLTMN